MNSMCIQPSNELLSISVAVCINMLNTVEQSRQTGGIITKYPIFVGKV